MIRTARSTTASLIDAKNWKTRLRCQLGREVGDGVAMWWAAIFREKWGAFNEPFWSCHPEPRRRRGTSPALIGHQVRITHVRKLALRASRKRFIGDRNSDCEVPRRASPASG